MESPSYYSVLPAVVRYDQTISSLAKLLYSEITALSNRFGYCVASNSYFAQLYGKTSAQISVLINQLIGKGYLRVEVDHKGGNARKLWIVQVGAGQSMLPIEKSKKERKYSESDLALSKLLYALIKERNPEWYVTPNWDSWAEDIRKIREIDKRPPDEIEKVIRWAQSDSFWQDNILSPGKLRAQMPTLLLRMKKQSAPQVRDRRNEPERRTAVFAGLVSFAEYNGDFTERSRDIFVHWIQKYGEATVSRVLAEFRGTYNGYKKFLEAMSKLKEKQSSSSGGLQPLFHAKAEKKD